jgi:hypothetical protein
MSQSKRLVGIVVVLIIIIVIITIQASQKEKYQANDSIVLTVSTNDDVCDNLLAKDDTKNVLQVLQVLQTYAAALASNVRSLVAISDKNICASNIGISSSCIRPTMSVFTVNFINNDRDKRLTSNLFDSKVHKHNNQRERLLAMLEIKISNELNEVENLGKFLQRLGPIKSDAIAVRLQYLNYMYAIEDYIVPLTNAKNVISDLQSKISDRTSKLFTALTGKTDDHSDKIYYELDEKIGDAVDLIVDSYIIRYSDPSADISRIKFVLAKYSSNLTNLALIVEDIDNLDKLSPPIFTDETAYVESVSRVIPLESKKDIRLFNDNIVPKIQSISQTISQIRLDFEWVLKITNCASVPARCSDVLSRILIVSKVEKYIILILKEMESKPYKKKQLLQYYDIIDLLGGILIARWGHIIKTIEYIMGLADIHHGVKSPRTHEQVDTINIRTKTLISSFDNLKLLINILRV